MPETSTRTPPPNLQPRLWVKVVLALLLVGIGVGAGSRFLNPAAHSATTGSPQSALSPGPAPVAVSDALAPLAGQVLKLHVAEGDRVAAGQVVAEIDPKPLEQQSAFAKARLAAAEADLKREEAALARLRADLPLRVKLAEQSLAAAKAEKAAADESLKLATVESEHAIAEAKVNVETARITRDFAKKDLDRYAVLTPDEAATLRRSQDATKAYALAVAMFNQAAAKLEAAQAGTARVTVARAKVDEAAANESRVTVELEIVKAAEKDQPADADLAVAAKKLAIEEAKQTVAIAESALALTKVKSPASGIVRRIDRRAGDTVAAGTPIIIILPDTPKK